MISIVYCTRESNPKHSEHLRKCSGELKKVEIIEYINKGEGLTKFYQKAIEEMGFKVVKKSLIYIGEWIEIVNF